MKKFKSYFLLKGFIVFSTKATTFVKGFNKR